MATAINPLSYLSSAVYQPRTAKSTSIADPTAAVDATTQLKAMQKQGDFQSFLSSSMAAALLQPADAMESGTSMTTVVNNMLQQVLGAYKSQNH